MEHIQGQKIMLKNNMNSLESLTETAGGDALPDDNGNGNEVSRLAGVTPTHDPNDPFDPRNLKLKNSLKSGSATVKVITSVPVRKPKKHAFFRIHAGEDYQAEALIYKDKDEGGMDKDIYLVSPAFSNQLSGREAQPFDPVILYLGLELHAERPFIWYVNLPKDGRDNKWWESARTAAERAKEEWIRIEGEEGAYNIIYPLNPHPDPIWTTLTFRELLMTGFKGHLIEGPDHVIMKTLSGAV
jgi:hypothetical protein